MNKIEIGDSICSEPITTISDIEDIIPVRYDGMEDQYIACQPNKAQYYAVKTSNGYVMISSDCKNKELFIDIV